MKEFCLHDLIHLAGDYNSSMDFYCDCGIDLPSRYIMAVPYDTKGDYQAKSYRVMDTIWSYAQNPKFCKLLKLFGGSAKEFSKFYHIPLEIIEKWENEEDTAPAYCLELIFSDMLMDESERFLCIKSNNELEDYDGKCYEYDEFYY